MSGTSNLRFILHVSDFHLDDDPTEVKAVLSALTEELKAKKFKVDYLVHTGDIINSSDLYDKVARDLKIDELFWGEEEDEETGKRQKTFLYKKYQEAVRENMENPKKGKKNRKPDINDLKAFNRRVENLVKKRFKLANSVMRNFISGLNVAFGNVIICSGNHDVLRPLSAKKSNWPNPAKQKSGYYCVNCVQVIETLRQHREIAKDSDKLNVIV